MDDSKEKSGMLVMIHARPALRLRRMPDGEEIAVIPLL